MRSKKLIFTFAFIFAVGLIFGGLSANSSPLEAKLISLSSQNFPFIYLDIAVSDIGETTLSSSNFEVHENGLLQQDYFQVTPPEEGGGVKLVDVVFLMDNSGSMGDEQAAVEENVMDFVNDLSSGGFDFALGLCRFGADENGGNPIIEDGGSLTTDASYFKNDLWGRNVVDGGFEPGWDALYESATEFNFRAGALKVFVLITDETPNDNGNIGDYSKSEAISALQDKSITNFSLVDLDLSHAEEDYCSIADATNGECFEVTKPFDDIFNYISTNVTDTYRIRYKSSNPSVDGTTRNVEATVSYSGDQKTVTGSYVPGGAPAIERTQNTKDLHDEDLVEGTELTIEALITDEVAPYIQDATLHYRKSDTTNYSSLSMSNSSENVYEATIPGNAVKHPGLDYYITATDGETVVSNPSADERIEHHNFAILPNKHPKIDHTPVTEASPGSPVEITAEIVDNTNSLQTVILGYHKTGSPPSVYEEVAMNNTTGDIYSEQIPKDYVVEGGTEYYIYAEDDLGIHSTSGSRDNPHSITVQEEEKVDLLVKNLSINRFKNSTISSGYFPKANKVSISADIANDGPEKATEVKVQFKATNTAQKFTKTKTIDSLDPGRGKRLLVNWELDGEVTEGTVEASILSQTQNDQDESNNSEKIADLNIYYVGSEQNSDDPYSLKVDAYSFYNWGVTDKKWREMIADFKDNVGIAVCDFRAFVNPSIAVQHIVESFTNEGGHCYGMSASSILYRDSPNLKPEPKDTYEFDKSTVVDDIEKYQELQLQRLLQLFGSNQSDVYDTIKNKIHKKDKSPQISYYFKNSKNKKVGHAVAGIQVIEWNNQGKVYLYDNNDPYGTYDGSAEILKWDGNQFDIATEHKTVNPNPEYGGLTTEIVQKTNHPGISYLAWYPLIEAIGVEPGSQFCDTISDFWDGVVSKLKNGVEGFKDRMAGIFKGSPGHLLITSSEGKIGFENGKFVNTLPGAKAEVFKTVEEYYVPRDIDYTVHYSTDAAGELTLGYMYTGSGPQSVWFKEVNITENTGGSLDVGPDKPKEEFRLELDYDGDGTIDEEVEPTGEMITESKILKEGWNLISIPGTPQNIVPQKAFGDDIDPLYMYRWNPAKGDYDRTSNVQLKAGASYWIYAWNENTEIDLNVSVPADSSIDLSGKGWQMVGPPFSINWGDVKVDGTKVKNEISGSSYEGPLEPYGFTYDEEANDYLLAEPDGWSDLGLNGWEGYWIRTTQSDVELGFDKGDSLSASASALSSDNQNILVDPASAGVALPPPPPMNPSKVEGLQAIASPTLVRDSGGVTFTVRSDQSVGGVQVEVKTPNGQKVWKKKTSQNELSWDTEGVPNGIYLYAVSARVNGKLKQAGIGKLLVLK